MQKLQTQGLHHITLVGADRQTSIDFWEGVLGMPFIFEQPNLDNAGESHIYFDPGDGRLITVFTREDRKPVQRRTPTDTGCVHHIAFNVSRAVFMQAVERLDARGIKHTGRARPDDLRRDLFRGSARPADRAVVLEVRRRRRASRAPRCCSRRINCASRAATARSWRFTWPTRSKAWWQARDKSLSADRSPKDPYRR